jgi:hypothetical protein
MRCNLQCGNTKNVSRLHSPKIFQLGHASQASAYWDHHCKNAITTASRPARSLEHAVGTFGYHAYSMQTLIRRESQPNCGHVVNKGDALEVANHPPAGNSEQVTGYSVVNRLNTTYAGCAKLQTAVCAAILHQ